LSFGYYFDLQKYTKKRYETALLPPFYQQKVKK